MSPVTTRQPALAGTIRQSAHPLDENLAVEHRYLHGPAVDQVLADEAFDPSTGNLDDVYWALADHQGTVRDVLTFDGSNAVHHEHLDWDAYGRLLQVKNGSTVDTTNTPTLSQGYTGRDHDPVTGLQNNLHRWYNPDLGRWMSQDPISFAGGDGNLYGYVFNSPTNLTDPTGQDVWLEGGSGSEPSGHQSINVGDPNGRYWSFSFAMTGIGISGRGCQGTV